MDPVSIVGLVGTCISLVANTSKTIKTLHDLKSNFREVAVEITHLLSQVSTIQSSVQLIQQWLNLSPPALQSNAELRKTIEQALEDCIVIIAAFEKHVSRIGYAAGMVSVKGKIRHLFDQEDLTKNQQALGYQMQALTLLLQAIQMTSVVEQQQLMAKKETRIVLKRVRDDASSHIDSRYEQSSVAQETIMSRNADPDVVFDFDDLVLDSQAYKSAFRSFMKKEHESRSTLRGNESPRIAEAPGIPVESHLSDSASAIRPPVTEWRPLPPPKEAQNSTVEREVRSPMFESMTSRDMGLDLNEPPAGDESAPPDSIGLLSESRVKTSTISSSADSQDRESVSGSKKTFNVSGLSATLNYRPDSDNAQTAAMGHRISDPSKHTFLLAEAFPYISDELGCCNRPVGVMRLCILRASDLTDVNRAGKVNSYVRVLSSRRLKGRTLAFKDSSAPSYKEALYVTIDDFNEKFTLEIVKSGGPPKHRTLGAVTVDPLDYCLQSPEGEYVSLGRKMVRKKLQGGLDGTIEFVASFYPCIRFKCTGSKERQELSQEPIDEPHLPRKVFLTWESLMDYSGVLFLKLEWVSTPSRDTFIFVDSAPYPSYVFDARGGSTSGFGGFFVRNASFGTVLITVRDVDKNEVRRKNITDLLMSDWKPGNGQNDYCTTLNVPDPSHKDKTLKFRLTSFFLPIKLPTEWISDAGILRIDVVEGRDFAPGPMGRRINMYCAFFIDEMEACRTKVLEKGAHLEWNETLELQISSRKENKLKMCVMEYPAFSWRTHQLIGERIIDLSGFYAFRAETCWFSLRPPPSRVEFRVLFQPYSSWERVSDDKKSSE